MGIVHRLNSRFHHGTPSNDLAQAGLLVHSSDGLWNPGRETSTKDLSLWLPCKPGDWCGAYADRLSAALVNQRLPYPFSFRRPNFVVRPSVGSDAILCMFAGEHLRAARRTLERPTGFC